MADNEFPFPMDSMDGNITPTKRTPEKIPETPEHIKRETERTIRQAIKLEKLTEDTKRRMEVMVRDAKKYKDYIPKEEEEYAISWLENYYKIRKPIPFSNKQRVFGRPYAQQHFGGISKKSKKSKKCGGTKKRANRKKN